MDEFLLLKFLHVVGFAYWLGTDLGVFYSSYFVANDRHSPDVRVATAKILFALDQSPRYCMTMMLPLGVHLTWEMGIFEFPAWVMALIWLICFGWLAMVITLYAARVWKGKPFLTTVDFWFRLLLSTGLVVGGALAQFTDVWRLPHWVALKLLLYGLMIGCGLLVRIKLKSFAPAFARLAAGEVTDADNVAIRESLGATRPYVIAIWIGLIASTAYGLHLI